MPSREDWELESGLADDFDGTIVDSWFEINKDYVLKAGKEIPMLYLRIETPDLDQAVSQGWSCGEAKQWEIAGGDKSITSRTRPDSKVFNMNARAGQLVGRMISLIGDGDKGKGQDFFSKRGFMTEAATYVGLNFHWNREKLPTVGEGAPSEVLLPTAYLGEVVGAAKATAAKAAAADGDFTEHYTALIELAIGLTPAELKRALLSSELKEVPGLMPQIFNKGLLDKLEAEGLLEKDAAGKYK